MIYFYSYEFKGNLLQRGVRSWFCNGSRQKPPVGIRQADGDGFPLTGSLDLNLRLLQKSCRNNIRTTGPESWTWVILPVWLIQFSWYSGAMTVLKSVTFFFFLNMTGNNISYSAYFNTLLLSIAFNTMLKLSL